MRLVSIGTLICAIALIANARRRRACACLVKHNARCLPGCSLEISQMTQGGKCIFALYNIHTTTALFRERACAGSKARISRKKFRDSGRREENRSAFATSRRYVKHGQIMGAFHVAWTTLPLPLFCRAQLFRIFSRGSCHLI